MSETFASIKQLRDGISLRTSERHVIRIRRRNVRIRLVGMFFEVDKSFLLPSAMHGISAVKQAYDGHPDSNILIIGHTDTSGRDDYNLKLSVERADAIAQYLADKVDGWEPRFTNPGSPEKEWGTREVQFMLSVLPQDSEPHYRGTVSGVRDPETIDAIESFQAANELAVDGIAGPLTRRALIRAYMQLDGTTLPPDIEVTTHGCGENFPVEATADEVRSPENRRVEFILFDGPITPPPPGKTSKKGSTEYPRWLEQVDQTTDVTTGQVTADALRLRIVGGSEHVIDRSDRFRLFSTQGYDQTLALADNSEQDTGFVDLLYKAVPVDAVYTLEVLHDGESYTLFENIPFAGIPARGDLEDPAADPLEPEPGTES